ncbi:UDP-glucose 4-epimerase [Bacteroides heparinolyticus]|uniref:UDP-glucose 4-epimerase n=1 Tax=Prevotella heparinolytica TaxID=28113 RepID=A0A4R2LJ31_9BACE|nr:NAD(P)-dependent oxidoreductase [Bacteroides heparinolyticus]TCO88922.1 UDP-glucose 4-epimerase [Bacteroides heparinolyticus]
MKIAIIGSKGYIGEHLNFYLKQKGYIPMEYDVLDASEPNYKKIDITNPASVAEIDLNVDYIFMFAGLTGTYVGFDKYQAYNAINEIGLMNLLDAIRNSKYRPKIIFPSTRLVYKGEDKALKESDTKETKTIYAVNKIACEGLLQAYKTSFDIPYAVFRICIPYGNLLSTDYSFGTVGFFIKQARAGKDITLYGGGSIKRTFTHMQDLCYQLVEGAFNPNSNGEIYNIGGETFSLKEAAVLIASKFGANVTAVSWPDRDLRIESDHTYFDDAKIQSLIGVFEYKRLADFIQDI